MENTSSAKNGSVIRWLPLAIGITVAIAFVAIVLPARFKLFGLWNVLFGLAVAVGVRQAIEFVNSSGTTGSGGADSLDVPITPTMPGGETPAMAADSDQFDGVSTWPTNTVVVVLALLAQLTAGGFSYFQYRSAVDQQWKSDPGALFAAKVLQGKISADQANAEHIDQMKELMKVTEATSDREEVLQRKKSWMTWALKRVDKTLGIESTGLAVAVWVTEVLLGCLAALFGFARWLKPKAMTDL